MLEILLNLSLDTGHKQDRLFKILLEKSFKFILNSENSIITFNLTLVLFLIEVDFILKKRCCKKNALVVYGFALVKIIFILLIKVVILYM